MNTSRGENDRAPHVDDIKITIIVTPPRPRCVCYGHSLKNSPAIILRLRNRYRFKFFFNGYECASYVVFLFANTAAACRLNLNGFVQSVYRVFGLVNNLFIYLFSLLFSSYTQKKKG